MLGVVIAENCKPSLTDNRHKASESNCEREQIYVLFERIVRCEAEDAQESEMEKYCRRNEWIKIEGINREREKEHKCGMSEKKHNAAEKRAAFIWIYMYIYSVIREPILAVFSIKWRNAIFAFPVCSTFWLPEPIKIYWFHMIVILIAGVGERDTANTHVAYLQFYWVRENGARRKRQWPKRKHCKK